MINEITSLPDSIVSCISTFIEEQKISTHPLIKGSIFDILDEHCTVLYYPQDNEENDGCLVKRIVNWEVDNNLGVPPDNNIFAVMITKLFLHYIILYNRLKFFYFRYPIIYTLFF